MLRGEAAERAIAPLTAAQWAEVGYHDEVFDFSIDWPQYRAADASGSLLTVVMRRDGEAVGFCTGTMWPDLYRVTRTVPPRRVLALSILAYYVVPQARPFAWVLVRRVEREAAARGAQIVYFGAKPERNRAGAFLEKLGYRAAEVRLTRLIGDAAHAAIRATVG